MKRHEPDVTVVVGNGRDDKREFLCYSAQLAHASPVLDAMLSSGMMEGETKQICFPDKDPKEWAIILECIDPAGGFLFDRLDDSRWYEAEDAEAINLRNARYFVYWFHELQMMPIFYDAIKLWPFMRLRYARSHPRLLLALNRKWSSLSYCPFQRCLISRTHSGKTHYLVASI